MQWQYYESTNVQCNIYIHICTFGHLSETNHGWCASVARTWQVSGPMHSSLGKEWHTCVSLSRSEVSFPPKNMHNGNWMTFVDILLKIVMSHPPYSRAWLKKASTFWDPSQTISAKSLPEWHRTNDIFPILFIYVRRDPIPSPPRSPLIIIVDQNVYGIWQSMPPNKSCRIIFLLQINSGTGESPILCATKWEYKTFKSL